MQQNKTCELTCGKFFVRLSDKIVDLDLAPFSEMVENHCCRSKKDIKYHNNLLSSQNDQTGSVVVYSDLKRIEL